MTSATASAPGKLMLFGEHAAVYGHPCLVTAVDFRTRVLVRRSEDKSVVLRIPSRPEPFVLTVDELQGANSFPGEIRFLATAIKKFWGHAGETFGMEVRTQSDLAHSFGLGSSSAVTVAAIKALSEASHHPLDLDLVFRLSYETVREAQTGLASGFDVAAATFGGTLYYVAETRLVQPLDIQELPLVIGYSGRKANTVEYVKQVRTLSQTHPQLAGGIMRHIASIVAKAKVGLERQDWAQVGLLMDLNQADLQALGVSTHELDSLIYAARTNGALGAKLSGAGGGDCIIALVDGETRTPVEKAIAQCGVAGAQVVSPGLGAEGVRLDQWRE